MAEHFGRFVKTAVFLSRGTIWGMFFSRKLLSAISLIGDGSSPFCAISSGNCLKGCVCVESNILGRNLFFQKVMGKNSGKCAKRFSDSSQINSPGMSKMLSACPVSSKFWGVFLEKECFFSSFLNFQQKSWSSLTKVFWAMFWSWVSRVQNNQQYVRIRPWKKKKHSSLSQTMSRKGFGRFR